MIHIVIPVYNRKEFTRNCLDSLKKQTSKKFKTIIIDDGSTDGTSEMLQNEYPEVEIIKGNGELFWTAAINLGIERALKDRASLILTLNNDTLASEDFIEKMYFWNQKYPEALLGALAINKETNRVIYGGERINWFDATTISLLDQNTELSGIKKVDHFPGRGLLIPKIVFDKIGLFNQKSFPHYYADYDFTHLAHRKGFNVYCNYDAKLFTYPEESGDKKLRKKKSFKNYLNHLFDIRGGGNLVNFVKFSTKHCPPRFLAPNLFIGFSKRLVGYWVK